MRDHNYRWAGQRGVQETGVLIVASEDLVQKLARSPPPGHTPGLTTVNILDSGPKLDHYRVRLVPRRAALST
jgi:hypothetical protein